MYPHRLARIAPAFWFRLSLAVIPAVIVLLGLEAAPRAFAASSANTGIIEGRIFNPRSGTVVEGARVSVESASLVTFTDVDGMFRLTGVPAGTVQLRIFYTGFAPQLETLNVV